MYVLMCYIIIDGYCICHLNFEYRRNKIKLENIRNGYLEAIEYRNFNIASTLNDGTHFEIKPKLLLLSFLNDVFTLIDSKVEALGAN